jgi:signal transduction histidine kinase
VDEEPRGPDRIGRDGRAPEIGLMGDVARVGSRVLLVSAGYYVGAIIGISLGFPPSGISTIWPPNAVVLAALLLEPPHVWWIYLLAALPTHLSVVMSFQPGVTPAVMLAQFAGNAVHILGAAAAVRAVAGAPPRFDSLRGMSAFVMLAAIAATAVACAVAVALFRLIGWTPEFWLAWRQRFFSNGFAVLAITPPIVLAVAGELVGARHPRGRRHVELALVAIGLVAVGMLPFAPVAPAAEVIPALLLAPLPLLLWAAVRLGPGGVCVSLLVVTCMSWAAAYSGRGPFPSRSPTETVLSLHVFLFAISVPLMFLAALVEERRRTQEETLRQRDELAHAQRITTLGELAASISHELAQPLSAIEINAHAAVRRMAAGHDPPRGSVPKILADIAEDASRAVQVIVRLRALFRKERAERVPLDFEALVESVVGLLRADLEQKRISLRFARSETLPPVLGDPVQLQQVVLNLLVNAGEAVAATDSGPRVIVVETRALRSGYLALSVRDTGIGVKDSGQLERIFERFVSSKPQGLGMGLTISRSIVEAHGGRIWAAAHVDRGLTLHVELPVLARRRAQAR